MRAIIPEITVKLCLTKAILNSISLMAIMFCELTGTENMNVSNNLLIFLEIDLSLTV